MIVNEALLLGWRLAVLGLLIATLYSVHRLSIARRVSSPQLATGAAQPQRRKNRALLSELHRFENSITTLCASQPSNKIPPRVCEIFNDLVAKAATILTDLKTDLFTLNPAVHTNAEMYSSLAALISRVEIVSMTPEEKN